MTTSSLVGPDTQSSQELNSNPSIDAALLVGATQRLTAYNRLRSWLRLPHADAVAAAEAFREAVQTLRPDEREQVAQAEADALRHGFNFVDFQKLRAFALRAIEDPFVSAGLDDDKQDAYFVASMMALSN